MVHRGSQAHAAGESFRGVILLGFEAEGGTARHGFREWLGQRSAMGGGLPGGGLSLGAPLHIDFRPALYFAKAAPRRTAL